MCMQPITEEEHLSNKEHDAFMTSFRENVRKVTNQDYHVAELSSLSEVGMNGDDTNSNMVYVLPPMSREAATSKLVGDDLNKFQLLVQDSKLIFPSMLPAGLTVPVLLGHPKDSELQQKHNHPKAQTPGSGGGDVATIDRLPRKQ